MFRLLTAATALLLAFLALPAQAIDESDLLPVEEAFALTASAGSRDTIQLHWDIAEGYYLYRGRIKARASDGLVIGELELPEGKQKHDEFFGDVQIYRDAVDARLPLTSAAGDSATVTIQYQGCADIGICYPPHRQTITVALPPTDAASTSLIPTSSGGFAMEPASGATPVNPLTQALQGQKSLLGESTAGPTVDELPLPEEEAFQFEAIALSPTQLLLRFTQTPDYYLYRDRVELSVDAGSGITLGQPQWPQGVDHQDEHFGKVVVYFDQIEVPLNIARTDGKAGEMTLRGVIQGCQNNGICYPPMPRSITIDLPAATAEQLASAQSTVTSENASRPDRTQGGMADQAEDSRLAAELAGPDRWLALVSFFGFGLLLAFTPCVFPMIPILSGIIAGAGNISTARAFMLSLVYVLATAVVFTIAGVVAGLAGQNLQVLFQQPWILTAFALVFVALSFSMFGFYELQLPSSLQTRLTNISNQQKSGSLIGVAIMGVLSALIVGPCVAPPLAASVLYIAQTRDPVFGGLALFALSLGMGAPLLLFGTAAGNLLPRAGAWMEATKRVFGVLFLALAIWMLERFLDPFWILLMSGALLIGCAVYLGALERIPDDASGWRRLWKSLGVILLLAGALELVGAAAGARDPFAPLKGVVGAGSTSSAAHAELNFKTIKSSADLDRELAAAKAAGRPVMFDFYADWCVSCKEMEKYTFTDPAVIAVLSNFVLLKADVTANDEVDQQLMQRFNIIGPPGTLFWARDGIQREGLRLIGFEEAAAFAERAGKATN